MTRDALTKAIAALGAVEVGTCARDCGVQGSGTEGKLYAINREGSYWIGDSWEIQTFFERERDGYETSLDDAFVRIQPPWWTPERRYVWRHHGKQCGLGTKDCEHREAVCFPYSQRITASLDTGEEIAA